MHHVTNLPQDLQLLSEPGLLVVEAEQSHAVLHEVEAFILQDGRISSYEVIEDGVVGLVVR